MERVDDGLPPEPPPPKPRFSQRTKLIAAWLFSVAWVFGPYIAGLLLLREQPFWVHMVYWLGMMTYVMAAATTTPDWDDSDVGVGFYLVHDDGHYSDDGTRGNFLLAFLLLPGKVVWYAISETWCGIFGAPSEEDAWKRD